MAREMAGPKFKFPYSQKKSGMAANTPVALALEVRDYPWGFLATSLAPDPVEKPNVLLWPLDIYMDTHNNT